MEGTMLWFNEEKRHGFISTDDGERLRVDRDGLTEGLMLGERCRGTRVSFERIGKDLEDSRAVNVALVPSFAPRRARMRGRH